MRITKDLLLRNAENLVKERAEAEIDLVAIYLTGSLLTEDFMLGDTADIDMVFIHENMPAEREIMRLTEDIHFDIQHYPRNQFEPARELRTDPWLGSALFNAKPMYDPEHYLDFVQASVRGMFHIPENILGRAEPFLLNARDTWMTFHNAPEEPGLEQTILFIKALENIANALSTLLEGPLPERRFLEQLKETAKALGQPGLYAGMLGLLGVNEHSREELAAYMANWEETFDKVSQIQSLEAEGNPDRKAYYQKGILSLLDTEDYHQAAWPLLNSWTKLVNMLHPGDPLAAKWQSDFENLNLYGEGFATKVAGLDAYLEMAEELFEGWKQKQGL